MNDVRKQKLTSTKNIITKTRKYVWLTTDYKLRITQRTLNVEKQTNRKQSGQ